MFNSHFEVFLADTPLSKEIHYSIRYQVYCEEMGFENKDDFPLEQEMDEFDTDSVHFIVRHKESGDWVGAMRLIRSCEGLPMERHCTLHEQIERHPFQKSVELSRLCVLKKVRKSLGARHSEHTFKKSDELCNNSKSYRRASQTIIWGLLNAASEYCHIKNKRNWYFMTCTALQKVLTKNGFKMQTIGEACEHKGTRYPFKKDVRDAYHNEKWRENFVNGRAYLKYSEASESYLKVA